MKFILKNSDNQKYENSDGSTVIFDTREAAEQHDHPKDFQVVEIPGVADFQTTFQKEFDHAARWTKDVSETMTPSKPPKHD